MITIIATCSVILMQAYWLHRQYMFGMKQQLKAQADSILLTADSYWSNYKGKQDSVTGYILALRGKGGEWETSISSPPPNGVNAQTATVAIRRKLKIIADSFDLKEKLPDEGVPAAVDKQLCQMKWHNTPHMLEEYLRTSLKNNSLSITSTNDTSRIWRYRIVDTHFFVAPRFTMLYGFNPLVRHNILISCRLNASPVLSQLSGLFAGACIWSVLMILCLVYQTRTLFIQYRIDSLRKDFAHTMIHELKRPVQSLKMLIALLQNKEMRNDHRLYNKTLTEARTELDNLSAYFIKLRDVTYGDEKSIPLNRTSFDLLDVAVESVRLLNISDTGKRLHVELLYNGQKILQRTDESIVVPGTGNSGISAGPLLITADRIHISNIINNLLENAVKYSRPESVYIEMDITTTQDRINLLVKDRGKGIPSDELSHVFEQFYRSPSLAGTDVPGIGLGLSYVKLLTEAHGGTVGVSSTPGKGTTFKLEMPRI